MHAGSKHTADAVVQVFLRICSKEQNICKVLFALTIDSGNL